MTNSDTTHEPAGTPRREATIDLAALERNLVSRAFLFDDPAAYTRGVRDTLGAVRSAARGGTSPAATPLRRVAS